MAAATTVIIALSTTTTTASALLKLASLLTPVTTTIVAGFLLHTVGFYIRGVGKLQLALGNGVKLALNGIIMHRILVPVGIRQLHVIGNSVGKALALLLAFLSQCFFDYQLQVFTQV